MQHEKAKHLRKVTPKAISDSCDHDFEKEYYLGADTGDKVCSKCGKEK